MKILVTGSAGHLGEALVRTLQAAGSDVVGLDILGSPCTSAVGSTTDRDERIRLAYEDGNVKANEFLYRRVDLADVVQAHLSAADKAAAIGFDRFVVSATTPFLPEDMQALRNDAPGVVARRIPEYADAYQRLGWRMFPGIDRVYVNRKARTVLSWNPRYDFEHVIECIRSGQDPRSPLSLAVGSKGYHAEAFADGPYPLE